VDNLSCRIPFAVRYLSVLDGESVPELLGSQPPPHVLATATASNLCRFFTIHDTTGLEHPRQQAETEFLSYMQRRQERAPAAVDPHQQQWDAERKRFEDLQRLTGQLREAKTAAQHATDEAGRLLRAGRDEEAAQAEEKAEALERRAKTVEAALAKVPTVEELRRRDNNRVHRQRQQGEDAAFAGENDAHLAELYRRLASLAYVHDGQEIPAAKLLQEAAWRGELAELLRRRLGVKRS
jgi:hypothetical protein